MKKVKGQSQTQGQAIPLPMTSEMDEDAYIAAAVKANSHLYEENQRPFSYEDGTE